jgi:hypothetical protein
VNIIGASVGVRAGPAVGGGGSKSDSCKSEVGSPTGTVMTDSIPLTVTVIDVFAFVGREQYPISTQFRPSAPRYGGVYVRVDVAAAFEAEVVALPPQFWRMGLAQACLLRYQQKRAALLRHAQSCREKSTGLLVVKRSQTMTRPLMSTLCSKQSTFMRLSGMEKGLFQSSYLSTLPPLSCLS